MTTYAILLTSLAKGIFARGKGAMKTRLTANPFMIRCVNEGTHMTIAPTRKRLAIPEIEALFEEVLHQMERGHKHIILDFSEVEWVCASTAGFLVELKRRLKQMGGSLRLRSIPLVMRHVLKLMQLDDRFEIIEAEVPQGVNIT